MRSLFFANSLKIHYLFRSRLHLEYSLSRIYYKFAFLFANKLWIHFEYFFFFCFANSLYIKKGFREIDLNQLSYSQMLLNSLFYSQLSLNSLFVSRIHFWQIHFLFRGFNLNWLSFLPENYKITILFAN